jgi:hypothetical protein
MKKKPTPKKKAKPVKRKAAAVKKSAPVTKKKQTKKKARAAKPVKAKPTSNPMQRNHLDEQTEVLVVYGWPAHVLFESGNVDKRLAQLTDALAGTDDVFVVAQDLVYCDGRMDTVFGRAVLRVHADDGPTELSLDAVRAIEASGPPLAATRDKLHALTNGSISSGPPKWYVVPTGCLASGFVAFGDVVPRDPDATEGQKVIYGCDMTQEPHADGVRGEWVGNASDWNVTELDLSSETHKKRAAGRPKGRYFVMGRYD